ncbi:hypothetical protein [Pseudalkalibacillus hwajinpoensis]|uniref:Uncharacterized protein n=1 Tax=Guptibacillus hwajinpoensis TaxID=208199 RepID=A0A4U1M7V7_9BACL|nr:hypothetical protein [Pseudalkalibacillus hwajinpoensis]TKD66461.1 hypothetical protein FBF83_20185 [Pseudalkalibacillus hwajinpoensis]
MGIKVDDYDLIELFECEPDYLYEKEQGIFMINKMDDVGIRLLMLVSIHEQRCKIDLINAHNDKALIELKFMNVIKIERKENTLLIISKDKKEPYTVWFTPRIALQSITF